MRQFTVAIPLLLLASSVNSAQDKAAKPEPAPASSPRSAPSKSDAATPIAALAWLIGGVWSADTSNLGPGMIRIETRYTWADNHAFIRFTTHFVMKDRVFNNYDGTFFWNPRESRLSVWYMDASNVITQGPVKMDSDNFQVLFDGTNFENKPAHLRVTVTRTNANLYTWLLEEASADSWRQMAKLDYTRQAGE